MTTPQTLDEAPGIEMSAEPAAPEPVAPEIRARQQTVASALEESEASYRSLFEANPHPMWIYDRETLRFLIVNGAAIEHYGYSQEEFLAMTIKDIRPAEDIPVLMKSIGSRMPHKGKRGIWRHRKKNGQIIDVEMTVNDCRFQGTTARLGLVNDITENRRIERALQQSEQEQRQLAEHLERERERLAEAQALAKVGSWDLNLTTSVLFWSDETYRIFGIDPLQFEASYEAFLESVHPEDRIEVNRAYTESLANLTPYAIDHRMVMADGSVKIVHERCQTFYDAAGRPLSSVGTVQDITEQKQMEQHLTRSLDLLRAVTEGTTDAIFAKDYQGRYLMINARGADFVGKTPAEIVGQDDTHLFAPETALRTMEMDRLVMESGETRAMEAVGVAAGMARTYHSTRGPLRDRAGNIIGVVGISRDVTEQRQAELTLLHIMEGAHCLLWQAEVAEIGEELLQWKLQFASEQAAQRFLPLHVTAERKYDVAWYLSRPVEDRERTDLYGAREVRAGRSYQQEYRTHSKDGALHWLSENVRVETLGEGLWRCTGICTDITERKLAEEASRAMTRGAQCLLWYAFVEEQPHGLQWYIETADEEAAQQFFPVSCALGQSYADAWAHSRMPEDSAAMNAASRDALLNGQQGYTQQFRCRRADGAWRWLNETVRIEALTPGRWHCVGVCTDVTEQKRVEEESDRFFTLSHDLLCIIAPNGCFTHLNPAFETVLGFTRAELMASPFLDFVHPEDREATTAETARLNASSPTLHFENRYRCRDGSYRWFAWTAIAYQEYLYGAAHDITPIKEAEEALRRSPRLTSRPQSVRESDSQGAADQIATILTIEDNLSNLRLLEVVLRSRPGITLLAAMQGSRGLELARQNEPDLILLDLNLPDLSGKEVLARLQASALTRDIPVIVLSADATPSQIERVRTAGAGAYLTKPLDVTKFLSTLDTLLLNKKAAVSADAEFTT